MEFNKEARSRLRQEVYTKIEELKREIDNKDEFKRLHIDKEWLEVLLFDEQIDEDGVRYKTIDYTYINIYYIDLSEVDWEDVSFDYKKYGSADFGINFQGTNAKFDFTKTYEFKKTQQIVLSNISFFGLDLSNNNDVDETAVRKFENALVVNCDLSNTNLKITTPNVHFWDSRLCGVDLSELNMYPDDAFMSFTNCDLRDTRLNIKIDDRVNPDSIRRVMNNPSFEGCNVGKTTIIPRHKHCERASELRADFEAWRDAMIGDICYDLDKQVNGSKKNTLKKEYDHLEPELPFEI